MTKDLDGLARYDLTWKIEGAKETQTGRLFELHEGELENARTAIRTRALRGDSVTINVK